MGHQVTMWSDLLIMTWVFQDLKSSMHSIIINDLDETGLKQAQKPQVSPIGLMLTICSFSQHTPMAHEVFYDHLTKEEENSGLVYI